MTIVLVTIGVLKLILIGNAAPSWTRPAAGNPDLAGSMLPLLKQLYLNFTGSYYLAVPVAAGRFTTTVALIWLVILILCAGVQIYRVATRRYHFWSHVLFIAVVATLLANWLLLDSRHPRYLLSINAPLVLLFGFEFFDLVDRSGISIRRLVGTVAIVLALQGMSMIEFSRFTYMWWQNDATRPSEARTLQHVIDYTRSQGATHAYSMNALLQWQISFYSRESVISRWKVTTDRYPSYITQVDGALNQGEPVAIVGYVGYTGGLENLIPSGHRLADFDGKYFVFVGADRHLLARLGFQLTDNEPSRSAVP